MEQNGGTFSPGLTKPTSVDFSVESNWVARDGIQSERERDRQKVRETTSRTSFPSEFAEYVQIIMRMAMWPCMWHVRSMPPKIKVGQ